MFKRNLLILGILGLCFFYKTNAQTNLKSNGIPNDLSIKLVRGACYSGNCPVYELLINSDGTVSFNGMLHTKLIGKSTDKISQDKLKNLISEFEKINFFSLKNIYATGEDGCTEYWSHQNWEWISLTINGKSKEVAHDFGCSGEAERITKQLKELGNKIDEIVETKRWIGERK